MNDVPQRASITIPGGSFVALLTVLFIGLKLGGVIDWHWIWVLSPLWLPAAILMVVVLVVLLVYLIGDAIAGLVRK